MICEELKNFKYEKKETVLANLLPAQMQAEQEEVYNLLVEMKKAEARVKEFTEKLCELMEKANVKKIDNELYTMTYVDSTQSVSLDSKLVKEKHPEVFESCKKVSNKKSFVKLTLKNQENEHTTND